MGLHTRLITRLGAGDTAEGWYRLTAIVVLIALCAITRVTPHPWNFTPVAAAALFAGARLGGAWVGAGVAIVAVFVSDLSIGAYEAALMVSVYAAYALQAVIGHRAIAPAAGPVRILTASIAAAVAFYFITNFAVWLFTPYYAPTLAGLTESYVQALPFFRNSLAAMLVWTTVFFTADALIRSQIAPSRQTQR